MGILVEKYFLQNLKFYMKLYNYKNVTLANELGVSKSAVSNYLAGKKPHISILLKMCELFGCSLGDLLDKDMCADHVRPHPDIKIRESGSGEPIDNVFYVLPLFLECVRDYNGDIYHKANFDINFYMPFFAHNDMRCYAVRMRDGDALKDAGIFHNSIAIFVRDCPVEDGEIAAVFLAKKECIVIRRVHVKENSIILTSDSGKEEYTAAEQDSSIKILGKVIQTISDIKM